MLKAPARSAGLEGPHDIAAPCFEARRSAELISMTGS
jgi:hypothetical protein